MLRDLKQTSRAGAERAGSQNEFVFLVTSLGTQVCLPLQSQKTIEKLGWQRIITILLSGVRVCGWYGKEVSFE